MEFLDLGAALLRRLPAETLARIDRWLATTTRDQLRAHTHGLHGGRLVGHAVAARQDTL